MSRPDHSFPTGTASVIGRCVSAEVRARMASSRWTQRDFVTRAGFRSQNYVSIRLRDEKPFTLDDVEQIAEAFGEDDPAAFIQTAHDRQGDQVWEQLMAAKTLVEAADLKAELTPEQQERIEAREAMRGELARREVLQQEINETDTAG